MKHFYTRRWLAAFFLLLTAACGSDDDTTPVANIVPIAQIPTFVITPTPTPVPPTATATDTPTATITPTTTPTNTATPTETPIPMVQLVIAARPIPAGAAIPPEAVMLVNWPENAAPPEYFTSVDLVINEVALVDIVCFEPVLKNTIAYREIGTGFEPLPASCPLIDGTHLQNTVDVVIARQDINTGQRIEPEDIAIRPWPEALVPPDAHQAMAEVLGTTAQRIFRRGQPIITN